MIEWTDEVKKNYKRSHFFAIVLFICAPLIYLLLTTYLKIEPTTGRHNDLMFYILMIIAVVYPTVIPIMEKAQIKMFHKNKATTTQPKYSIKQLSYANKRKSTPSGLYLIMFIIRASLVESSFLFGLVVYMIAGDLMRMLYFYPIGIAWTIVYFPTKKRCEKFLEKVSSNAIV